MGKGSRKKFARRRANEDPVDKKIRSLVGGRLLRIARENSPKLPHFLSLCVNIHFSSIQFMASIKRDNLTRYDIQIEEERIERLKRGTLLLQPSRRRRQILRSLHVYICVPTFSLGGWFSGRNTEIGEDLIKSRFSSNL